MSLRYATNSAAWFLHVSIVSISDCMELIPFCECSGALQAGFFTYLLFLLSNTISSFFISQELPDQFTAKNITVTIRTAVGGLAWLATFIFGMNTIGLSGTVTSLNNNCIGHRGKNVVLIPSCSNLEVPLQSRGRGWFPILLSWHQGVLIGRWAHSQCPYLKKLLYSLSTSSNHFLVSSHHNAEMLRLRPQHAFLVSL